MCPTPTSTIITSHFSGWGLELAVDLQVRILRNLLVIGPCVMRLVAGISSRKFGFEARPVRLKFEMDKVVLRDTFLRLFRFSPVSIIPPTFCVPSSIH